MNHLRDELLKLDDSIAENQKLIVEISAQLKEKNLALAKLSLDEIQSQVFHWNTTVAVSRKARQEAERRKTDLQASIERINQQVDRPENAGKEYPGRTGTTRPGNWQAG